MVCNKLKGSSNKGQACNKKKKMLRLWRWVHLPPGEEGVTREHLKTLSRTFAPIPFQVT